jgi:hypothetical protein
LMACRFLSLPGRPRLSMPRLELRRGVRQFNRERAANEAANSHDQDLHRGGPSTANHAAKRACQDATISRVI